jgi:fumarate hydratase, class II
VVQFSGALRGLAGSLKKIADDLRLLSSGPRTGLGELRLPAVQPGSSIMPGKVNPVLAEMLNMVCSQVMGCDAALVHAAQAGQLELNVMMPVIGFNLLFALRILANGLAAFTTRCIDGIEAEPETCLRYAETSSALATALSPAVGYHRAAELAQRALREDTSVRALAEREQLLPADQLVELLDLRRMTDLPPEKS